MSPHSSPKKTSLQEILHMLKPLAEPSTDYCAFRKKCTHYSCLGIRLPHLRALYKKGFSFSDKPHETQSKIWNTIWREALVHEAMHLPLFYFEERKDKLTPKDWAMLKSWISRIDGWEHSDMLSKIYSFLLERFPKLVYPTLKKWNRSLNPWERRNSIVPLILYASPKRKYLPPSKILPLIKILLKDPDPYVQKAVGWTLRECHTLYAKETLAFFHTHIRTFSAIAFSYATERLTLSEKQLLKQKRSSP
ncbi:MAG: alkylation repair enzyme protein [Candidatus Uhrbacteria bacterium GW2011_GWE2_46_68]|uniref:Alkylation repair enzyme protein n=2 Tax=Candidatus Uhriibacteriota TaxID=1752732 RepID=A0A0G1Q9D4_9BACT|nr:MAG: alkylation repair enzyme protein [Candidatus Uhrbacteria bacterium GW2011_GWF2_46_218]KKU41656.1 MAG: alkylation repair enzyme protein [Candidatus Uhrbacteria bacterium GW2011_GWE2_46_68]